VAANDGYFLYVSLELQKKESDCMMTRVEGKHDFFQGGGWAQQLVDSLINFPP
jgi:hypothetical protein